MSTQQQLARWLIAMGFGAIASLVVYAIANTILKHGGDNPFVVLGGVILIGIMVTFIIVIIQLILNPRLAKALKRTLSKYKQHKAKRCTCNGSYCNCGYNASLKLDEKNEKCGTHDKCSEWPDCSCGYY